MDALREFIEGRVPNEWVRVPGEAVAFERDGLRVEIERVATPQRFRRRWEIRCRESAGEAVGQRTVRYASSWEGALDAVYDCMRRPEDGTPVGVLSDRSVASTTTAKSDARTATSTANVASTANAANTANTANTTNASPRVERG
ncbi:hypothetical protein [Haloprofundus sp. MHR1]|uniref:hypothetical protein n=1 Tax=Haloprofundus sp. MHR1 TaxID=2572921 RepID=UPI0010BE64A2|nr:hypothetical protein [Haloprofundus sp. MHR1]QCJ46746.1 hypothetical protein FCF25_06330 [Haloprofundus sp. MHR1]